MAEQGASADRSAFSKWKVAPNPLVLEEKTEKLGDVNEHVEKTYIDTIRRWIKNAQKSGDDTEAAEIIALGGLSANWRASKIRREHNRAFVDEFNLWLLGKSKYNVKKQRRYDYNQRRGYDVTRTPWGNKSLARLDPSIPEYLSQISQQQYFFAAKLTELKLYGPQDLNSAWLYYKYIVRKRGFGQKDLVVQFMKDYLYYSGLGPPTGEPGGVPRFHPPYTAVDPDPRNEFSYYEGYDPTEKNYPGVSYRYDKRIYRRVQQNMGLDDEDENGDGEEVDVGQGVKKEAPWEGMNAEDFQENYSQLQPGDQARFLQKNGDGLTDEQRQIVESDMDPVDVLYNGRGGLPLIGGQTASAFIDDLTKKPVVDLSSASIFPKAQKRAVQKMQATASAVRKGPPGPGAGGAVAAVLHTDMREADAAEKRNYRHQAAYVDGLRVAQRNHGSSLAQAHELEATTSAFKENPNPETAAMLAAAMNTIERSQETMTQLRDTVTDLEAQTMKLRDENEEQRKTRDAAAARVSELEMEASTFAGREEELVRGMGAAQADKAQAVSQLLQLREQNTKTLQELQELQNTIETQKGQLAITTEDAVWGGQEVERLQQELEVVRARAVEGSVLEAELKKVVQQKDGEFEFVRQQKESLEQQLRTTEEALRIAQEERNMAHQQIQQREQQEKTSAQEILNLKEEIKKTREIVTQLAQEALEGSTSAQAFHTENSRLREQLENLTQKNTMLDMSKNQLERQAAEERAVKENQMQALAALQTQLAASEERIGTLETEKNQAQQAFTQAQANARNLEAQLQLAEESGIENTQQLNAQIQEADARVRATQEALHATEHARITAQHNIGQLLSQLELTQKSLGQAQENERVGSENMGILVARVKELEAELTAAEVTRMQLIEATTAHTADIQAMNQTIIQKRDETIGRLSQTHDRLQDHRNFLQQQLTNAQEAIRQQHDQGVVQNEVSRNMLAGMMKKLNAAAVREQVMGVEFRKLQGDNEVLEVQLQNAEELTDEQKAYIEQLEAEEEQLFQQKLALLSDAEKAEANEIAAVLSKKEAVRAVRVMIEKRKRDQKLKAHKLAREAGIHVPTGFAEEEFEESVPGKALPAFEGSEGILQETGVAWAPTNPVENTPTFSEPGTRNQQQLLNFAPGQALAETLQDAQAVTSFIAAGKNMASPEAQAEFRGALEKLSAGLNDGNRQRVFGAALWKSIAGVYAQGVKWAQEASQVPEGTGLSQEQAQAMSSAVTQLQRDFAGAIDTVLENAHRTHARVENNTYVQTKGAVYNANLINHIAVELGRYVQAHISPLKNQNAAMPGLIPQPQGVMALA